MKPKIPSGPLQFPLQCSSFLKIFVDAKAAKTHPSAWLLTEGL
jgi:hypothetical protein